MSLPLIRTVLGHVSQFKVWALCDLSEKYDRFLALSPPNTVLQLALLRFPKPALSLRLALNALSHSGTNASVVQQSWNG